MVRRSPTVELLSNAISPCERVSDVLERTMHPLEQLGFSCQVAKRAQYEAFQFSLTNQGMVVRNGSHTNPEDHECAVRVDEGIRQTVSVRPIKRMMERANTGLPWRFERQF